MKHSFFISMILILCTKLYGQTDFENRFDTFRAGIHQSYKVYHDSINVVFAKSIEANWKKFKAHTPLAAPKKPLPQMDVFVPQKDTAAIYELEVDSVIPNKRSSEDADLWDFQPQGNKKEDKTKIHFYGSELQFHDSSDFVFSVADVKETTVAAAWKQLSDSPYKGLVGELLFYANDMNLNDWGMYQLLKQVALHFYPAKDAEQVVFSVFIMNQLGYRLKIGRCGSRLIPLVPFQTTVYGKPFITVNDERFYILEQLDTSDGIYSYFIDYQNARRCVDLQIQRPFRLALSLYSKQCKVGNTEYTINVNRNLMEFYRTYPQTDISVYANTPISGITRKSLEKELLPMLQQKTEREAVDFLLEFVQMAFAYKNDIQQFGYEKFFFAEELFYYPYSDCEDRSVLFSQLVRRFLGLQVVLLDYPDHVTTAVRFNQPVSGDFINVLGEKYVICDPTYLHARTGQSIPRYKNQKAKIYMLD